MRKKLNTFIIWKKIGPKSKKKKNNMKKTKYYIIFIGICILYEKYKKKI